MVKVARVSGREAARVFEKAGWVFGRRKGSHMIYVKDGAERHLSIPDHKTLKIGLLIKLIKAAGLTPQEFEELGRK